MISPSHAAPSNTLNVPASYSTIQAAIDSANVGDTVLVAPGTYSGTGNIDLNLTKDITVKSSAGAATTIIDCQGTSAANHIAFNFKPGVTSSCLVQGFTIQNGYGRSGGAINISCAATSPFTAANGTVQKCIFKNNKAFQGGALFINASNALVTQCDFIGNSTSSTTSPTQTYGGAIEVTKNNANIVTVNINNSTFRGNSSGAGEGAAIDLASNNTNLTTNIYNCSFYGNSATTANNGTIDFFNGTYIVKNCIFWGAAAGKEISTVDPPAAGRIQYCNINQTGYAGVNGNISSDPKYVDAANGDLRLQASSPSIGAGNAAGAPTVDHDGTAWTGNISMGAFNGVAVLPPHHFAVTAPASAVAGTPFNVTVTAQDSANGTTTGYSGVVHFTSTDPSSILPADATLTNGVGTFSVTLGTGGNQTITATDTVTASITSTSGAISTTVPNRAPDITTTTLANTVYGSFYSVQLQATDADNDTLSWLKTTGDLPAGLSLGTNGSLSGTPTQIGTFPFDVQVSDGHATDTATLSLTVTETIKPSVAISTPNSFQSILRDAFGSNTISGTASDNVGVTGVTVQLKRRNDGVDQYWNGTSFDLAPVALPASLTGTSNVTWKFDTQVPTPSELDYGTYTITVVASDASANTETASTQFNVVRPFVATISSPINNQKIRFSDFTGDVINGTASGDMGVDGVKVRLSRKRGTQNYYWNGTAFTTSGTWQSIAVSSPGDTDVTWTLNGQLPSEALLDAGLYQIEAYAVNSNGEKSPVTSRPFTLFNDDIAPSVSITTPTLNQKIAFANFSGASIGGTATDNLEVKLITIRLSRKRGTTNYYWNGTDFVATGASVAGTVTGTTDATWNLGNNAPGIDKLDDGLYQVEATATDAGGNKSAKVTQTFTLLSDVTPPSVTISTLTSNQKILISDFNGSLLNGTATDDKAVTVVKVRLGRKRGTINYYWNGTDFVTSSATIDALLDGNNWNLSNQTFPVEKLDSGLYQIEVTAQDAANNKNTTVIRTFTLGTDFTAPTVTIATPSTNQKVDINAFGAGIITGSASDNIGVTSIKVRLVRKRGTEFQYWNGTGFVTTNSTVDATLNGTSWSLDSAISADKLDLGTYTVYALGTDAVGNPTTSASRTFSVTGTAIPAPDASSAGSS